MTPEQMNKLLTSIKADAEAQQFVTDEAELLYEIRAILVLILELVARQ